MMGIGNKPFDEDDIESLNIDIDKILGDGSVKTNDQRDSEPEPTFSLQTPSAPTRVMDCRPDDLIIQNLNQGDDISTTLTEEIFYRNTQTPEKEVQNDDRHTDTDGTEESCEESPSGTSSEAFGETHYKYACVLAVLLLLIICGLGFVLGYLAQNKTRSQGSKRTVTVAPPRWTVRPTPPPSVLQDAGEPSPTHSVSPTRLPTPVTQRPSDSPSEGPTSNPSDSPTTSAPAHLLELLRRTTSEKTIEAIGIWGTSQQKAFEWLYKDPSYFIYTPTSKIQRFSLAVLYFSAVKESPVASEALETWMDYDTHECAWYTSWYDNRLPCGSDGIFKFLALRNINLEGKLPSELGLLSRLVALVLNDNALTGTIPQEFGEWTSLETLDLHGNFLRGRLPTWQNVPKLTEINLSLNALTGFVPASIGNLDIKSLDLTQNPNLAGVMPFELCSLPNQIEVLAADCNLVYCSCCTRCDSDATRVPFMAPPTTSPRQTPRPTSRLTPNPPTVTPSLKPISPPPTAKETPAPTTRPLPLPVPLVPTPQPTLDPNCIDHVQTSKQCYVMGEPIDVIYSNCNPTFTDWIGIYGTESPEDALFDPLLSHPTCINEPCLGVQQISTIILDGGVRGSSNWPLPSGRYIVYMFHGGSFPGPYAFVSKTLTITVTENSC